MTLVLPEGTPTLGNTKVTAVLSVTDRTAPKLATEISAATSVDISCFLFPEGWNPAATVNKGARRRRLCSRKTSEVFNTTQYTMSGLQYVHKPQAADTDPINAARKTLVEGLKVYLVERQGLDAQTDTWTVGEYSITHYVQLGPQIRMGDPSDENGEYYIMQDVVYVDGTGPVNGIVAT